MAHSLGALSVVATCVALALFANADCGGKVVVDVSSSSSSASSSSSTPGSGGAGGALGSGGGPAECAPGALDQDIQALVGLPCSGEGTICASNNGCGGCSVTCRAGIWTSTDATLCFSIGGVC